MEEVKQYKPILVFYHPKMDYEQSNKFTETCKKIEEDTNYSIIRIQVANGFRAEIISVDKATVVEDIQKYIDDNQSPKEGIFAQHLNIAAEKRWEKEFGK